MTLYLLFGCCRFGQESETSSVKAYSLPDDQGALLAVPGDEVLRTEPGFPDAKHVPQQAKHFSELSI